MISNTLGEPLEEWITNLNFLRQLTAHIDDKDFLNKFVQVKRENKARLKEWVLKETGIDIPLESLYDVQVKRIHEYKR